MNAADSLARFRADPRKIRVAIRRIGGRWRATVSGFNGNMHRLFVKDQHNPAAAIMSALESATGEIAGVDLAMGYAYEHPFGVAGVEARRE